MELTADAAKAEFMRAKTRLAHALETTPDDKLNWSPSPTARTPIHQVAHAALSIGGIQGWLMGKPFDFENMAAMDAASREFEKGFSTREAAIELLETNANLYTAWLDSLTAEQLGSILTMTFGTFPMSTAITFPADHLRAHAAQIDYIQTIYGDLDWHMG